MNASILSAISAYYPELVAIRHDLHMHPELAFEEVRTANVVKQRLGQNDIPVHEGYGKTGLVGLIKGTAGDSDQIVGLRADMDALPLTEQNTLPYKSKTNGKMHGCGHDGHTVMLLGAAEYLAKHRHLFAGSIALIFQPAEEGYAGGKAMIDDGLFDDFPIRSIYALHNWPSLPVGAIGVNDGPMMAGIDTFTINVIGQGGHGGHPESTIDASLVAAQIVSNLQQICSRNLNPLENGTIGIHYLNAGAPGRLSIVPQEAEIHGMAKWYQQSVQQRLKERLSKVCTHAAEAWGAQAKVEYKELYPPTINTPKEANLVATVAEKLVGKDNVITDMQPSMGSEDFSFMLQQKPGAYFRLGIGSEDGTFLHSPKYKFNDESIPFGAATLAQIAIEDLKKN